MKTNWLVLLSCTALLAGCAQQQQQGKYTAAPAPAQTAAPAPAPAPKAGTVSAYFPSGKAEGSGLLIEKTASAQVFAGQSYQYTYKVSNLTDATLENVTVMDGDNAGNAGAVSSHERLSTFLFPETKGESPQDSRNRFGFSLHPASGGGGLRSRSSPRRRRHRSRVAD